MSSRTPGLGTVSTRTREDARQAAGRIGLEAETVGAEPADGADPDPSGANADEEFDSTPEPEQLAKAAAPATPKVSARGRRKSALPASLTPSRVSQRRIQIGPRLRPNVHTRFTDYSLALSTIGVTQSDVVESALVEYMDRYPADAVRAALLDGE